jgi:tellurite resistance protein TerC
MLGLWMFDSAPPWAWWAFAGSFSTLLVLDLFSHRGGRLRSHRAAVAWAAIWVVAGLSFVVVPWIGMGGQVASSYLAAYFIEKSLSLDNLFVFLLIFQSLNVPLSSQRVPLSWGILGALVFRGLFIFAGAAAVERWDEVNYLFAAVLMVAAWRTFRDDPSDDRDSPVVRWLARHLPITHRLHGDRFLAVEGGAWVITPLLLAIIALELTDILFAVDSVPAAFSVSDSPFVIYSSNAFAILGLRSLYIVLANYLRRLVYLHYGLAAILVFAAGKIAVADWLHIPAALSVAIIAVVVTMSIAASLLSNRPSPAEQRDLA